MPSSPHLFNVEQHPRLPRTVGADAPQVLGLLREHEVRLLRLQFTDLLGATKHVEVPAGQFERALAGEIFFSGAYIQGFDDTDLRLQPDLDTFLLLPWGDPDQRVAALICDIHRPDGTPFEGDPRGALRRMLGTLDEQGLQAQIASEVEFFLFRRGADGAPTTLTSDPGGYFDLTATDRGDAARRDIVAVLQATGFQVEQTYHEVAPGQHEIDFLDAGALAAADNLATFKHVVRTVALRHDLHATFMPKPLFGQNGSGMHFQHSLFRGGENVFHDAEARDGLSDTLRHYVGGLLRHARACCAITNPLVNSYKRLVPGYEAPVSAAWSLESRASLLRVPAARGAETRCEMRMPDPSANPYLALTVLLAAGLDGVREEIGPGDPIQRSIWTMSERERRRRRIEELPRHLGEALEALEGNRVIRSALGEHIYSHFTDVKRAEFSQYLSQVHPWEIEQYLGY